MDSEIFGLVVVLCAIILDNHIYTWYISEGPARVAKAFWNCESWASGAGRFEPKDEKVEGLGCNRCVENSKNGAARVARRAVMIKLPEGHRKT
jgi:hypothetical protein